MPKTLIWEEITGHTTRDGVDHPIVNRLERVERDGASPYWIVTRGLCQDFAQSIKEYEDRKDALTDWNGPTPNWGEQYMKLLVGATITGAGIDGDRPWLTVKWTEGKLAGHGCRINVMRDPEGNGPGWLELPNYYNPTVLDRNLAESKSRAQAHRDWCKRREGEIRSNEIDPRLELLQLQHTGGGCMAYSMSPCKGWYILLTDEDAGVEFDYDTEVLVGLYREDGEGDDNDIRDFTNVSAALDFILGDGMAAWIAEESK